MGNSKLTYKKGCLIEAFKDKEVFAIAHQVNCQGVMGSGVAKTIAKEFPQHKVDYLDMCDLVADKRSLLGGNILTNLYLDEDSDFSSIIIGCFGQEFYGRDGRQYTNHTALTCSLYRAILEISYYYQGKYKIGIPYMIGCGLGGGDWTVIESTLNDIAYMMPAVEIIIYKNN